MDEVAAAMRGKQVAGVFGRTGACSITLSIAGLLKKRLTRLCVSLQSRSLLKRWMPNLSLVRT